MKPIFYRCKTNDECYKLVMEDDIPQKQIDACLDAIGYKNSLFITEEEFESTYEKVMDIDVLDTTDTYKIGVLTTRWLDMSKHDKI
ncbi:hypothetical protein RPMD05_63 [Rhodobacteraceae phage LS06-2018-MD05]|nr:hypothetical protein RPMD05_63 [Rhodobacteraceae phage LS06-2018-MD05]